ncbi:hypothetical protein H0H87_005460 [Tephrocybe sp. NHM501043]|nr:hypothetical protein H0H87_005460 [Tephrocybe sp. NHM501043]
MPPPPAPSSSKPQRSKRKSQPAPKKDAGEGARKKRKTKGKSRAKDQNDELETSSNEDAGDVYNPSEPRWSRRTTQFPAEERREVGGSSEPTNNGVGEPTSQTNDVEMIEQAPGRDVSVATATFEFELGEEEEKPKPILQLKYQGFDIFGHCLCVVVEPWPPVRSMSRAPSVSTILNSEPSLAPPPSGAPHDKGARGKTPLFLPDDYRERSETPAPFHVQSITPKATSSLFDSSFLEDSDSEDDGGMMLFSQVLNNAGDVRAGAADDDEDMDTEMFFGDADEMREL